MWVIEEVEATENGIVIFDPAVLVAAQGGQIEDGRDLFALYTSSEKGDEILAKGAVVPILGIDWYKYKVVIRLNDEPTPSFGEVVRTNQTFALTVELGLRVTGLGVLKNWQNGRSVETELVPLAPGSYAASVRGFRRLNDEEDDLLDCGYEIELTRVESLPEVTADTGADMGVICWD